MSRPNTNEPATWVGQLLTSTRTSYTSILVFTPPPHAMRRAAIGYWQLIVPEVGLESARCSFKCSQTYQNATVYVGPSSDRIPVCACAYVRVCGQVCICGCWSMGVRAYCTAVCVVAVTYQAFHLWRPTLAPARLSVIYSERSGHSAVSN